MYLYQSCRVSDVAKNDAPQSSVAVHPSTDCDTLPNVAFVEIAAIDASAAPAHALIHQFRQLFGNTRGLFGHHAAGREALTSGSTVLSAGLTCAGLCTVWRAKPGLLVMFVPTSDCQLYMTRFQQTLQHGRLVEMVLHQRISRTHGCVASIEGVARALGDVGSWNFDSESRNASLPSMPLRYPLLQG